MNTPNQRCCVKIRNVPPQFTIADIRAFFSSFVETGKFEQFHIRACPRPAPSTSSASAPAPTVTGRTGLYTPVVRRPSLPDHAFAVFASAESAAAFSRAFHGKKWASLASASPAISGRCVIERVTVSPGSFGDKHKKSFAGGASLDSAADLPKDCEAASSAATVDIPPAPARLPRGNIGTPTSELLSLVSRCVLPCAALKQMGLQHFAAGGVGRKFKDFNFKWPKSTLQTGGCSRETHSDDDADGDGLEAAWGGGSRNYTRRDRMETRELLHEEEVEDPWDKGDASGLVWYTDAQYWDSMEGDLDDRTSDGLDVVGCGGGGWTRLHGAGGEGDDAGDGERFCDDATAAERTFERFVAQGLPGSLLSKWGLNPDTYSGRLPVLHANRTRTGLGWQGRADVNVPLRRFHEEIEGEDLAGSVAAAAAEKQHVIGTVFDKVPVADVSKRRRGVFLMDGSDECGLSVQGATPAQDLQKQQQLLLR